MPRSSSTSTPGSGDKPTLGRAMATILALPLTPISKAKGGLLLFKKRASAAARRHCSYKPFRHYNYAYVGEYQFSPSRSPLLTGPPPGVTAWRRAAAKKRRSRARMILASLFCGGDEVDVAVLDGLARRADGGDVRSDREQLVLAPALEWGRERGGDDDDDAYTYDDEEQEQEVDYGEDGDEEVDGRAERFIERFYAEMRLQRQRSVVQRLL
ncbi:hypothetical protein SEVIR_5G089200v4 [Setaria viridis]|uniref:Uncharacterized protein n=1 Tax=Setaria viridis TaxID=4556 RepID=A0A4U6UF87_SETVI|nr:uncharacterized protein LOC117857743 [Setaria viridis]TKW13274.1 hypothetical protein SEVIR_5G089200v2 [Setaria viridis]